MTELEKGTVKIDYTYYFGDRDNDWYVSTKLRNCSKVADDKSLKNNQEEMRKNLNKMTGGNFVPITYDEYIENTEDEDE